MKHKLKVSPIALIMIIMLVGSYLIGQYIVKPKKEATATKNQVILTNDESNLEYIGRTETTDNPWGYNVGTINTDEYGRALFLTPNTSVSALIKFNGTNKKLFFGYRLHPWVDLNTTDGSNINVEVYPVDEKENKITKSIYVDSVNELKEEEIDLSKYNNRDVLITISCDAGKSNDATNDWILITNARIK